jgi:hypothetical protein
MTSFFANGKSWGCKIAVMGFDPNSSVAVNLGTLLANDNWCSNNGRCLRNFAYLSFETWVLINYSVFSVSFLIGSLMHMFGHLNTQAIEA